MSRDEQIDRELFLAMLAKRFPEVIGTLNDIDHGLIHLEVAAFRRCVETAMDQGQHWNVERYLAFIQEILPNANPSSGNALEVSFIADLALG